MKHVLVFGMGKSGQAAAKFLVGLGKNVLVSDDRHFTCDLPITMIHRDDVDFQEIEMFIPSPGIPRTHPIYEAALEHDVPIVGEAELALRHLPCKAIGITGTNGKSSMVSLVAHVLNCCGMKAHALGNIGTPLIEVVPTLSKEEIVVAEISSYQLETMTSQVFDAAAILNITPDHLERYDCFENYANAKLHLITCVKDDGICFVSDELAESYCLHCQDTMAVPFEQIAEKLCETFGVSKEQFIKAKDSCLPLPHRIQYVGKVKGIDCINDSKATNLDATIHAVEKIESRIILIAGGKSKGDCFRRWIEPFKGKVKQIIAYGAAGGEIAATLGESFPLLLCSTMEDAISKGLEIGEEGDHLLLSPGCSSFDQFRSFEERGERFIQGIENESKRYHSCCSTH